MASPQFDCPRCGRKSYACIGGTAQMNAGPVTFESGTCPVDGEWTAYPV